MARLPRYVIPGQPQHIIQRGNNRQVIFAAEADYQFFRDAIITNRVRPCLLPNPRKTEREKQGQRIKGAYSSNLRKAKLQMKARVP